MAEPEADGAGPLALGPLTRSSRQVLRELIAQVKQGRPELPFNKVLAQLLDPAQFRASVFPGVSDAAMAALPKSFQELLGMEEFHPELLAVMPRVEARADEVIRNVKRKGAAEGEVMNEATEAYLRPRVLQEAFAREIAATVQQFLRKRQAARAAKARTAASPFHVAARWEQLDGAAIHRLWDDACGFALLPRFLSPAWAEAVGLDAQRFLREDARLSRSGDNLRVAWVDQEADEKAYPALAEAVRRLQGLPFELNAKTQSKCLEPEPNTTMLSARRSGAGAGEAPRLDGGAGDADTGYRLSCLLLAHAGARAAVRVLLQLPSGQPVEQALAPGALLLWRSRQVASAVTVAGADAVDLRYWVQGPIDRGW